MSCIGKAPSTEGRIQWKESTLTDYKRVLWGSTPEDRAELADLERKGAVVKTGDYVRGSDGYMCDAYVMTPRFGQVVLEDLERSGHLVRTGEYRLSRLGFEPVYVATEYADEALRRQERKRN